MSKGAINHMELADALRRVVPFASKDEVRQVLQRVLFDFGDNKVKIVAVDGFRMAEVTVPCRNETPFRALVPADILNTLVSSPSKSLRSPLSNLDIVIDDELYSDEYYPDYGAIFFKPDLDLSFPSGACLPVLESIVRATRGNKSYGSTCLRISISEQGYSFEYKQFEDCAIVWEHLRKLEIEKPYTVAVNIHFLIDVLKSSQGLDGFRMQLKNLKDTSSAAPLQFTAGENFRWLVMPMHAGETLYHRVPLLKK